MLSSVRINRQWVGWLLCMGLLVACGTDAATVTPRETVPAVLYITPAATLDVDATVTAYALSIIPTPTPSGMYIVKSGDTLSGIATDFGTTVEDIMEVNKISDPTLIQPGQALIVSSLVGRTPQPAPTLGPEDAPTLTPTETPIPTETPVLPEPSPTPTA